MKKKKPKGKGLDDTSAKVESPEIPLTPEQATGTPEEALTVPEVDSTAEGAPMTPEESAGPVGAPVGQEQVTLPESEVVTATQPEYPAVPEEPDPPSYAPIVTGLGISVTAWGFLTDLTILGLGIFLFCYGMSIWIKELTHHEP